MGNLWLPNSWTLCKQCDKWHNPAYECEEFSRDNQ